MTLWLTKMTGAVFTVTSTRGGGLNCAACFPVPYFRVYGTASNITEVITEIGGVNPSASLDAAFGILTNAQSVSSATVDSNGVTAIDFVFNFNTDNTNKYKFIFVLPTGTILGEKITTTGTRSNSTSEFSLNVQMNAYTVISNRRITYRVKSN